MNKHPFTKTDDGGKVYKWSKSKMLDKQYKSYQAKKTMRQFKHLASKGNNY